MQFDVLMRYVFVVIAIAVVPANGQSGSGDDQSGGNNTTIIVATSVVVSLVLFIIAGLTVMMWVCACCKPENRNAQQLKRRTRWDRRYIQKSTSLQTDKVPVLEDVEEAAIDDEELKRLSDARHPSLEVIDNQVWRSSENLTNIDGGLAASCEDLSPKQSYVRKMNCSESENDFQTLKLDEAIFESSSRSKSEAQLHKSGVSDAIDHKELLGFYDMDKPQNSPRKKDYFSTGDVSFSKFATAETLLQEEPESPEKPLRENRQLTGQQEVPQLDSQENNQRQTSQNEVPESTNQLNNQQLTSQHDTPQSTNQHDVRQSANQQDIDQNNKQRSTSQHDIHQSTTQMDNQHKDFQDGDDQTSIQPSQEGNASDTSDSSLRERLTGTPDSGVVLSEETSSQDQSLIKQEEKQNESDSATETAITDHDAPPLSTISSAPQPTPTDTTSFVAAKMQTRSNKGTWEPVANRKQRYLEMIEQDTSLIKSQPLTRKQNYKPEQISPLLKSQRSPKSLPLVRKNILLEDQESEKDSDFDEGELLSSSQPMLNLTNDEDPKPKQHSESDSESETEEMHTPLIPKIVVAKRLEAKDDIHITSYTNPSLSDSDDDDSEMVKPDSVVIHRSPVKTAKRDQQRASHPPLQRTIKNEYFGSGVVQTSKKRKHQPKLNSIIEEDR